MKKSIELQAHLSSYLGGYLFINHGMSSQKFLHSKNMEELYSEAHEEIQNMLPFMKQSCFSEFYSIHTMFMEKFNEVKIKDAQAFVFLTLSMITFNDFFTKILILEVKV